MEIINPTVELWIQGPTVDDVFKHIERCARVCYKSEPKGEAKKFVEMLLNKGHFRPLEAGTVVFDPDDLIQNGILNGTEVGIFGHYSPWCKILQDLFVTNFRWLVEMCEAKNLDWSDVLKHMKILDFSPSYYRPTLHWNISRGISDEFRTHVSLTSLCESTRYVNYQKKGMQFVKPIWYDLNDEKWFQLECEHVEERYTNLINAGFQPQQAREILPLSIATNLVQCGFMQAWENFWHQRCTPSAHPDARFIAEISRELIAISDFKMNNGLVN